MNAAEFRTLLGAFRRRLIVLAFRRHALRFAGAAMIGAEAVMVAVQPTMPQAVAWVGCATAIGVVLAGAITLARRPSLQATAAALDRRFKLADLIVTALQFANEPDDASRLVVRHAGVRLALYPPAELVADPPIPPRRVVIFGAAALLLGALVMARHRAPLQPGTWVPAGTSSADMPGGRRQASAGAGPVAAPPGTGTVLAAAPAPDGRPGGTSRTSLTAAAASMTRSVDGQPGTPTATGNNAITPPATGADSASVRGAGPRADGAGHARSAARSDAGGDAGARGALGGGQAGAGPGTGAGGLGSGVPAPPARFRATTPRAGRPGYVAEYQRARARTEAAMDRARVPARFRTYVRDYFLAIHPTGKQ